MNNHRPFFMKCKVFRCLALFYLLTHTLLTFAYDFEVDGLYYSKLSNNTVEVTFKEKYRNSYSGEIYIPEIINYNGVEYSVTSIGADAFSYCGLTGSLTIPNTVTSIGDYAFAHCSRLTGSLTIPNSVTTIGDNAFRGCSGFSGSLTIPNSVTTIGDYAFEGCTGFTASLSISNSLKEIGNYVFSGCSGFYNKLYIPNSVVKIGNGAFSGCNFTGSLTIPDGVVSIGEEAFSGCKNMVGLLTIGNSVVTIGSYAFSGCSGFTGSLKIPSSVESIGSEAFWGCNGLSSVTIPNSVTSIGSGAFKSCSGLTSVTIGNSVTSISDYAFERCSGLTSVTIGNGVTSIGMCAFSDCSGLTSVTIPNSVTSIGNSAFKSCSGLISVTIPNSVTSIGNSAFSICSSLTSVTSKIQSPFALGYDVFDRISSSPVLYVPQGTKSKYEEKGWTKYFSDVVEKGDITQNTYSLNISASGNGTVSYNNTSIRNKTQAFTVNEGTSATITFTPDNGYRIKSVKLNSTNVTSSVSNNKYSISNITANTTLAVTFEAIPVTTYSLNISASGNGSVTYDNTSIRNKTQSFTVNEGTSATITFIPDNGNSVSSVKVNGSDVTSQLSGNRYAFSNITGNNTMEVLFQEDVNALTVDGLNYTVTSQTNKTVTLTSGGAGQVLTVPATITQNGTTWKVTGVDNNALKDNVELAAIIWDPEAVFTATVSNPNLLLYVKDAQYAPAAINNVIVNGTASSITLTDAESGNNFYCPQQFIVRNISYIHHYGMATGIGESRGWETISLPFDVQSVTHATKGAIVPFAKWKSGDTEHPFWLYELNGTGWAEAQVIKAYTPYIISMPNNSKYKSQFQLAGNVTFAAANVTVGKTENLHTATYSGRTFTPTFSMRENGEGLYALNVNNDFISDNSGMTEGSRFVLNMRKVHPFEAYMTAASQARQFFEVFETGTEELDKLNVQQLDYCYDLAGRKIVNSKSQNSKMPKGVYIMNGKKIIIK